MSDAAVQLALPARGRVGRVAGLAAPLIAFALIPNAVGLAATAMVGRLGTAELAGMGIAGVIFSLLLALLYGFDTGVQAMVSRATGAEAREFAGRALGDAHATSIPFGALLAWTAFHYGPMLARLLTPDAHVAEAAGANLEGIAPSLFFFAITIPFNAYWIGSGEPRIAFLITAAVAPLQVAFLLLLIFGKGPVPPLGMIGLGLAQTCACFVTLLLQLAIARAKRVPGLFRLPRLSGIATIAKIGWPVSLQQSFEQVGTLIAYTIIAQLGAADTAIVSILISLMLVPVQTATGLGGASATLVGQSLGRGDAEDARRWGWQLARAGAALLFPLGMLALFAPNFVLGLFLVEPKTLALAIVPARMLGLIVSVEVFSIIIGYSLRGAGATKSAAGISFLAQWMLLLPLMWLVGIRLHGGFNGIVVLQITVIALEASAMTFVWARGRWANIRIASLARAPATRNTSPTDLQRIAVLGGAGAGKSTFSRAVGEKLGLPVFHLDRFIFGPNWTPVDLETVRVQLKDALAGGRWVVDGTYGELRDLTLAKADLVIWIEQPVLLRLWRTWRKTRIHKNRPRLDRPDGCEERFTLGYVRMVLSFGRFTRRVESRMHAATSAPVICLKGDRAVRRFLAGLDVSPSPERAVTRAPEMV